MPLVATEAGREKLLWHTRHVQGSCQDKAVEYYADHGETGGTVAFAQPTHIPGFEVTCFASDFPKLKLCFSVFSRKALTNPIDFSLCVLRAAVVPKS